MVRIKDIHDSDDVKRLWLIESYILHMRCQDIVQFIGLDSLQD